MGAFFLAWVLAYKNPLRCPFPVGVRSLAVLCGSMIHWLAINETFGSPHILTKQLFFLKLKLVFLRAHCREGRAVMTLIPFPFAALRKQRPQSLPEAATFCSIGLHLQSLQGKVGFETGESKSGEAQG